MTNSTEKLIERLVADAAPVRRLRPPFVRAALWLAAVAAAISLAVYGFADTRIFLQRASDTKLAVELAATLATGIAAAFAAFELSVPDRSSKWALLPLLPFAVWIGTSGYSCYRHWLVQGSAGWEIGESEHCFAFILAASLPLGASLLILLGRSMPLAPAAVAATGGLAVAGIAAFALQFFHPFDVTFMDLGVHMTAVTIVVLVATVTGNRATPWRSHSI